MTHFLSFRHMQGDSVIETEGVTYGERNEKDFSEEKVWNKKGRAEISRAHNEKRGLEQFKTPRKY